MLPFAAWKNDPSAAALTIPGVGWGLPGSGEPATINKALGWMKANRPDDKIKFIFDHDTDGWEDLRTLAKRLWGSAVILVEGRFKEQLPLQASDRVAWELQRFAVQGVNAGFAPHSVKPRAFLAVLMDKFQPEGQDTWLWANETELRNMCASQDPPGPTPRRAA